MTNTCRTSNQLTLPPYRQNGENNFNHRAVTSISQNQYKWLRVSFVACEFGSGHTQAILVKIRPRFLIRVAWRHTICPATYVYSRRKQTVKSGDVGDHCAHSQTCSCSNTLIKEKKQRHMHTATISVLYVNDSQDFTSCVSLVTLFIKKPAVSSYCSLVTPGPNSGQDSLTVEVSRSHKRRRTQ
jgi:hypothetical protein